MGPLALLSSHTTPIKNPQIVWEAYQFSGVPLSGPVPGITLDRLGNLRKSPTNISRFQGCRNCNSLCINGTPIMPLI